ncbi:unnamed protein product, partial [Ixodes hexagonus]
SPYVLLERLPPGSPRTMMNLQKLPHSQRHPRVLLKRLSLRHCRAFKKKRLSQPFSQNPLVLLERLPFNADQTSGTGELRWPSGIHGRRCPSLGEGAIAAKKASARKAPRV